MRFRKRTSPPLLCILLICTFAAAQDMPPTLVVTAPVEKIKFHDQITLVGRTEAYYQSQIASKVAGQVESIVALEGNIVRKGDPLIQIDSSRVALFLAAKRAETGKAGAEAKLAVSICKRAEDLWNRKLISEIQIDSARVLSAAAEERHHQLLAEQNRLELDLADCTIRAPFGGYTGKQLISVGEWVDIGDAVFEMTNLNRIKINVDLPEKHFGHLALGTEAIVFASVDEGNPLKGTVTGFAPNATEATHTFPVIITIDNSEGRLGAGMLVRATLSLKETFSSLAVSKDAIVRQGNQAMVYTISDGKAAPIPVTTTSMNGELIAVTGPGLAEGMPVVVRGNERIFRGAPVITADGVGQNAPAKQ
ncbi:MAG: efflux RND transporter periplasmic adaptor subunit [Candidatus Zixiibacteriota bacterium]